MSLLEDSVNRLMAEQCGPDARQAAEETGWASECWDALAAAGLAWVGVPDAAGGVGGELAESCAVIRLAGRHAVPLPLAECSLLGGWLAAQAGLRLPDGAPISVAVPRSTDTLRLAGRRLT
ncbi:MAG: acyl-CoA dehydrogenase family protein, partial [Sciscionella sp.]